jgi:putative Mn2+ efflux pump MntP
MIKLPVLPTVLAVAILSILTFWLGIGCGRIMGHHLRATWTWVASGMILVCIGLLEIILALPMRT